MKTGNKREIKVYNSQKREKEIFKPLKDKEISMYVCGPTVYNYFHIGNARCFVVFDFIRRFLEYVGYKVNYVQNFTDVDDKMIKKANEENTTLKEIAEKYIAEYKKDAEGLGIRSASVHPRATENIDEMTEIISELIKKGYAYSVNVNDGTDNLDVYFSTENFKDYGRLSHMKLDELEAGARIETGEIKRNNMDFALWKAAKPNEPYWNSPWGKGRPGWHIECSAMAKKYLGETIDLHCGGVDLTFPHHENEMAQSEGASGKTFVNYWLHNGFINIENKKMSKSEGIFFTVREISEVYGYQAIRFFVLSSHYRSPINFSKSILESGMASLERIYTCGENLKFSLEKSEHADFSPDDDIFVGRMEEYRGKIIDALSDDFNTADAIGILFDFIRDVNIKMFDGGTSKKLLEKMLAQYNEFCELFGFVREVKSHGKLTESDILGYIEKRAEAKKQKNYAEADKIRNILKENNIILEDTAQGTKWKMM